MYVQFLKAYKEHHEPSIYKKSLLHSIDIQKRGTLKLNNVLPLVGSYKPHLSNSWYYITYLFCGLGHV